MIHLPVAPHNRKINTQTPPLLQNNPLTPNLTPLHQSSNNSTIQQPKPSSSQQTRYQPTHPAAQSAFRTTKPINQNKRCQPPPPPPPNPFSPPATSTSPRPKRPPPKNLSQPYPPRRQPAAQATKARRRNLRPWSIIDRYCSRGWRLRSECSFVSLAVLLLRGEERRGKQ